jgi:hypothetical protein
MNSQLDGVMQNATHVADAIAPQQSQQTIAGAGSRPMTHARHLSQAGAKFLVVCRAMGITPVKPSAPLGFTTSVSLAAISELSEAESYRPSGARTAFVCVTYEVAPSDRKTLV